MVYNLRTRAADYFAFAFGPHFTICVCVCDFVYICLLFLVHLETLQLPLMALLQIDLCAISAV